MLPSHMRMFVCISFHYNSERLTYLQQVIKGLNAFPCHIQIVILTNTANHDELRLIQAAANANCHFESKVVNVSNMIHPFILPWAHKAVMKQQFESDESLTHFAYLEDDMGLTPVNMAYWIENRKILWGTALYPSLIRVEQHETTRQWHSTDQLAPVRIASAPQLCVQGCDFINMTSAYCNWPVIPILRQ